MFSLDALFCDVDDFCQSFEPQWKTRLLHHGGVNKYDSNGDRDIDYAVNLTLDQMPFSSSSYFSLIASQACCSALVSSSVSSKAWL